MSKLGVASSARASPSSPASLVSTAADTSETLRATTTLSPQADPKRSSIQSPAVGDGRIDPTIAQPAGLTLPAAPAGLPRVTLRRESRRQLGRRIPLSSTLYFDA